MSGSASSGAVGRTRWAGSTGAVRSVLGVRIIRGVRRSPEVVIAAVGIGWMFWLAVSSRQWFYADEWDFIAKRSRPPRSSFASLADMLLTPHNEHWSTLPILVYRAVFGVVGLRAYWPYLVVLYTCHALVIALLVRLLRRHGVSVATRCFAVAIFVVYGAGAENLLWAFQFAWMAACIAGLLIVEIVDVPIERFTGSRVVAAWIVGVAGLMCAGVGVSMVAAGAFTAWLRWGWRRAFVVASVPAAVQVLWTVAYGRNSSPTSTPATTIPHRVVGYAWRALSTTIDRTVGLPGVGALVLVGLIVVVVRSFPELRSGDAGLLGLAGACAPFLGLVAVGRIDVDNPNASRYSYVLFVLMAPLVFVLVDRLIRGQMDRDRLAGRRVVPWSKLAAGVGALAVITSVGTLADAADREGVVETQTKRTIVAAFSIARSNFAADDALPDRQSVDLTISGIRKLLRQGKNPPGSVDPQSLTAVLAQSSVDVTPEPRVPLDGRSITIASLGRMTATPVESGCIGFFPQGPNPQVSLLPRRPASIKIVPLVDGTLGVVVRRDGRSAEARPVAVVANNPVFVNLADPRNEYVLSFPADGQTKACGLGQSLPEG